MDQKSIICPSCGAPGSIKEGESKWVCLYCKRETFIESKIAQNLSDQVKSTFQTVSSQTQQEIQKLQLAQEISMLQMQLTQLNTEKRSLERENSKTSRKQLSQVLTEENKLLDRISFLQRGLLSAPPPITSSSQKYQNPYTQGYIVSSKSWGSTVFLAFTLGFFGAHRYYTGKIKTALIQTFTGGGFLIWWVIDIITLLSGNFTDSQGLPLNRTIKANKLLVIAVGAVIFLYIVLGLIGTIQNTSSSSDPGSMAGYIIFTLIMLALGVFFSKAFSKN